MVCQLFSFAQECDIPTWFSLIIEAIIGFIIAISFFIYQKRKEDSRARTATKRVLVHLFDLKKFQDHLRESIIDYYYGSISQDALIRSLEGIKQSSQSLEMMLILYSNSIDENILSKIEHHCGFIKIIKLSGEKKEFDLTLCGIIDEKWEECIESLRDFDPVTYKITEEGKKQYDANAEERMNELIKISNERHYEYLVKSGKQEKIIQEMESKKDSINDKPFVKDGITIYPDGTRVDSHGTIL